MFTYLFASVICPQVQSPLLIYLMLPATELYVFVFRSPCVCVCVCARFIIKAKFATKHVVNNKLAQHGYYFVHSKRRHLCHACKCVYICVCLWVCVVCSVPAHLYGIYNFCLKLFNMPHCPVAHVACPKANSRLPYVSVCCVCVSVSVCGLYLYSSGLCYYRYNFNLGPPLMPKQRGIY